MHLKGNDRVARSMRTPRQVAVPTYLRHAVPQSQKRTGGGDDTYSGPKELRHKGKEEESGKGKISRCPSAIAKGPGAKNVKDDIRTTSVLVAELTLH